VKMWHHVFKIVCVYIYIYIERERERERGVRFVFCCSIMDDL
jgi:hypothetical protein